MSLIEPVSKEDLARFQQLDLSKKALAERLLSLEEEKIRIMAATKRISDEWTGLFSRIASERGLDPNSAFDINPKTGAIDLGSPPAEEQPEGSPSPQSAPSQGE